MTSPIPLRLRLKAYGKQVGVATDLRSRQRAFKYHNEELARRHAQVPRPGSELTGMSALREVLYRRNSGHRTDDGMGVALLTNLPEICWACRHVDESAFDRWVPSFLVLAARFLNGWGSTGWVALNRSAVFYGFR